MIAELSLNGSPVLEFQAVRVRNEINQGLHVTSFFVEGGVYIPALPSSNRYTLRYYNDDKTVVLDEFVNRARFRSADTGPWYTTKVEVTEIQFLIEESSI